MSTIEKLRKLQDLYSKGFMTKEEYDERKKQIINDSTKTEYDEVQTKFSPFFKIQTLFRS